MPAIATRVETALPGIVDRIFATGRRVFHRVRSWPWWAQVGLVWLLGRVFSLLVVLTVAHQQGPNPWSPSQPGYLDYIDGWDANWYHKIFDEGYPRDLPQHPDGDLKTNQWAFYPVLPALARLVTGVTGASWLVVAPLISTLASLGLCLLLFRLFRTRAPEPVALMAVTLFSFQPAAPILQFPYAESLGLLVLVAVLLLVIERRFLLAVPLVLLLGVTRPMAAPLALSLGLLGVGWFLRRDREPVERRDWWRLGALTVAALAATAMWPVIVGVVTGDATAYVRTEAAWHGNERVLPGELWANIGIRMFGKPLGVLAPVLFVLGLALLMATRTVRRLGAVMYLWTASYLLYTLGVIAPNGAFFRLMMPAFPLFLAASMASRSKAYRVALLVLCLVGQIVWVTWLWHWSGWDNPTGAPELNP